MAELAISVSKMRSQPCMRNCLQISKVHDNYHAWGSNGITCRLCADWEEKCCSVLIGWSKRVAASLQT